MLLFYIIDKRQGLFKMSSCLFFVHEDHTQKKSPRQHTPGTLMLESKN